MFLTDDEKRMLDGQYGAGAQKAMTLLIKFGDAFDAEKMVRVNSVHISPDLPIPFMEEMSEGIGRVSTLCSLHATFDPRLSEKEFGLSLEGSGTFAGGFATTDGEEFARHLAILDRLGFLPTFSCTPYLTGIIPRQGDVLVWSGTSGQVASNSLFAAKANREGLSSALASAITGKTPYMNLLIQENRHAKVLVQLDNLDTNQFTNADYGALGYYIGSAVGSRNVAVDGLPGQISLEQCKFLTSPLPVSGACTMCHIVGVTPEARTLGQALGNKRPEDTVKVGETEMRQTWEQLNTGDASKVDLVIFGCPHCTILEISEIASLLEGKRLRKDVRLSIGTSDAMYGLARQAGYARIIEEAGGRFTHCCAGPVNPLVHLCEPEVVATNSARAAHYIPRATAGKTGVFYGDTRSCIDSATTG